MLMNPFSSFWRDGWQELRHDLRTTRWARGAVWTWVFLWIGGLAAGIGLMGALSYFTPSFWEPSACTPDNDFRLFPEKYSYWDNSGFFQITLGLGQLTFGQAKVVDIAWDVVVGRGGQALLAWISWKVFAFYFTAVLETGPVTYSTFRAIFIQDGPSVESVGQLIRDFTLRQRIRSTIAMGFMILSMIFVLAFPTLASAMTGYANRVQAYVPDVDRNFIRFNQFQLISHVIHDGARINLTDDFYVLDYTESGDPVMGSSSYITGNLCQYMRRENLRRFMPLSYRMNQQYVSDELVNNCYLQNNISEYTSQHGFFGRKNEASTFMGQTLDPPVLNISAFYIGDDTLFGYNYTDPETGKKPFNNQSTRTWTWTNETYSMAHIQESGSCQANERYQWGFSFVQLFIACVLLFLWSMGMYIMWVRAQLATRNGDGNVAGEYKSVVQLAATMHKQLGSQQENLTALKETEISRLIKDANGGRIMFSKPLSEKPTRMRTVVKNWFKREKWWFISTLVVTVIFGLIWVVSFYAFVWMPGPLAGLILGMALCTTSKSRTLLILFFCTLTAIPTIITYAAYNNY